MTALEKSEELRREAITTLLVEREAIDEQLQLLGYDKEKSPTSGKRRGRPPKAATHDQGKLQTPPEASRTPDTGSDS